MLYVWYPKNRTDLKVIHEENDVIEMGEFVQLFIPGTANLSFNIELTSTADPKRTLVSNIGRAIIKNQQSSLK